MRGSPEQQDNERGKQAALANIQRAVRAAGTSKDDIGGVFGVQDVGAHHAQLVFHGWRTTSSRRISQLFEIEQGSEPDIRVALIKKVIAIIRAEKPGDFPWESHRLGREITLSARPADQAGLEQFLMREFFPDYAR
ncbi:MAG: hypothetical protein M3N23_04275 [Pseudomonadota bacterium]|nr:hypothetical protein [Pseudomonadota bacterium]